MKYHKFIILTLMLFSLFFLTGCTGESGIETKAYVIAIGIDTGETDTLKLSLQIAILSGNDQTSGSSGGSNNDASTVISVDCSSIDSGISLINSYISKQINLSHCKAIIISEEYASKGVSDIIYTLVTNVQVRPDCNIIISKCDASDYLEQASPIFESNPANYYELILNATEYTGYVADIYLYDFYSSILSKSSQACAILGGINTEDTHEQSSDSLQSLDGNFTAGQTPIKIKNKVETIGSAVFVRRQISRRIK